MKPIIGLTALLALIAGPVFAQGTIKAKEDTVNSAKIVRDEPKKANAEIIYFRTCKDARAAGYSRMRTGDPGYSRHLDRDNDGIACE